MTIFLLICLTVVGIYDLYLYFTGRDTISQKVHEMFPKWIDVVIMVSLLACTWWAWGPEGFLPVMLGTIIGHLFWYGD